MKKNIFFSVLDDIAELFEFAPCEVAFYVDAREQYLLDL